MYPLAKRSERIADGVVHAIGVLAASCGAVALVGLNAGLVTGGQLVALVIYGITLIATFAASAAYHMAPWHGVRPVLRRIDHAAIYLKIAGTYTPLVVMVGSTFAYVILSIVWGLAAIGMTLKLFFWKTPGRFGPVLPLAMGWISLGLIWPLWPILPGLATGLIVVGGLIYTTGVVFYASNRPFTTAIWHALVLAASACFWGAIALGIMAIASGAHA